MIWEMMIILWEPLPYKLLEEIKQATTDYGKKDF